MPSDLRSSSSDLLASGGTYSPPVTIAQSVTRAFHTTESFAPSRRDLLAIGCATLVVRFALFLAAAQLAGWSLDTFANLHDGPSYLRMAGGILDADPVGAHIDRRGFT